MRACPLQVWNPSTLLMLGAFPVRGARRDGSGRREVCNRCVAHCMDP
jgi:hypothetical protein